jgi:hypothetical protein
MAAVDVFNPPATRFDFIDRWMYAGMAALLALTGIIGFAPRSMAILEGELANPPLVVHVHAAMMAIWLGLLVAQATLAATGRLKFHRTLGLISFVIGPCLVAAMIAVTTWRYQQRVEMGQIIPGSNTLLAQIRAIVYFSLFFTWAIVARKSDSETHKRMMILATVVLVPAAVSRMTWLPTTMPASYLSLHASMLLLLVPAFIYDVARRGAIHKAYWIGLLLLLPWIVATHSFWSNPWWIETAKRFML